MTHSPKIIMYTEDDTFNMLRREPFDQLRLKVRQAALHARLRRQPWNQRSLDKLLSNAGWQPQEYRVALAKAITMAMY